ncbi:MAG: hypothetical protein LBR79_01275 [Oscillospiraceae bacterium]|jgi:hypothetical protein|nr:hypothetical protein [Oscillospiraceae bacterium]
MAVNILAAAATLLGTLLLTASKVLTFNDGRINPDTFKRIEAVSSVVGGGISVRELYGPRRGVDINAKNRSSSTVISAAWQERDHIIVRILEEIDVQAKQENWSAEKTEAAKIDAVAMWADKSRSACWSAVKERCGYKFGKACKDLTVNYDPQKPESYLAQVHPKFAKNPHRIYYRYGEVPYGIEMTRPNGEIVRFYAE